MNKLKISRLMMIVTILLVAGFQGYWITRLYNDEWHNLQRESDFIFRDVVYKLQLQRFRNDTSIFNKSLPDNLFVLDLIDSVKTQMTDTVLRREDSNHKAIRVSINTTHIHGEEGPLPPFERVEFDHNDSFTIPMPPPGGAPRLIKYFSNNKSITDSLSVAKIDSAYRAELKKNNITVGFTVTKLSGTEKEMTKQMDPQELKTSVTFVGLTKAYAYQAEIANPFAYIIGRIAMPIVVAILLVAFTIISFVFLYRNLLAQKRLSEIKNEFISNITHELKTPIATVNVAIEALRNFNAIQNPERTKEYLDISATELQRLSLLVDKVLRFSVFENKEVELKKEWFDLKELTQSVINSMGLQFDKQHAEVSLETTGENFVIEADKLHITSVVYNLLDNALKYSKENPSIKVELITHNQYIDLKVTDKGIGIPTEYKRRVFDKFFRVPSHDHHNAKGYGLGLSYVNHIVQRHQGFVEVESEQGKGSTFIVKLPYKEEAIIHFDKGRRITKSNKL
ncbi:MAG TPA: HAMP domain-containing sensor histidine kinase [Panacibacter sp.]|nr:HAMP domain-containing sensor histidine kinase [Panacibacter sp.]HNP44743.1 HAMP domain-containing sensor histidine kinase [Panacibacter sp.]